MERSQPTLRDEFERKLEASWPAREWLNLSIVLGVSGGPDSVALLRAMDALRSEQAAGRFEVAHFNHRWRQTESNQDELFVRQLCEELDLKLHVGSATSAKETEEAARNDRLRFLQQTAEQRGARYLVLAHTADDQAETILHRILRGTGLRGLGGIPARRQLSEAVTLARPLLWARRSDVRGYLERLEQAFRSDSSNTDLRFTRNRIRHELLPHLTDQYNPNVVDSLQRLGRLASEADAAIQEQVKVTLARCVRSRSPQHVELHRHAFLLQTEFLQREMLAAIWREQRWPEGALGFEQRSRLVEAIRLGTKTCLPSGIVVQVQETNIRLTSPPDTSASHTK